MMNRFAVLIFRTATGESESFISTILLVFLISKISMIAIMAIIIDLYGPSAGGNFTGRTTANLSKDIFLLVVFDPITESLLVLLIVWLTGRLKKYYAAVIVGALNIPMHGLSLLSLSVFPVFFLHGLVQRNWKDRGKPWTGYAIITIAHLLHNATSVYFMYYWRNRLST